MQWDKFRNEGQKEKALTFRKKGFIKGYDYPKIPKGYAVESFFTQALLIFLMEFRLVYKYYLYQSI